MSPSRREFLAATSLSLLGGLSYFAHAQVSNELPPGSPSAFGTGPDVGPEVTTTAFAEAEKLVQVTLTAPDRAEVAGNWRKSMAPLYERRVGPRKLALESTLAPA